MAMYQLPEIGWTYMCRLMRWGLQGWKGSETTTKNDRIKKRLDIRHFSAGSFLSARRLASEVES